MCFARFSVSENASSIFSASKIGPYHYSHHKSENANCSSFIQTNWIYILSNFCITTTTVNCSQFISWNKDVLSSLLYHLSSSAMNLNIFWFTVFFNNFPSSVFENNVFLLLFACVNNFYCMIVWILKYHLIKIIQQYISFKI